MSRTGDRCSPFGVAPPKAGNASRFRLRLATMRRIGEIRRANFLERRSGPRRGLGYLSDLGESIGDHALAEIRRFQMAEKPPSTDNSTPFT